MNTYAYTYYGYESMLPSMLIIITSFVRISSMRYNDQSLYLIRRI